MSYIGSPFPYDLFVSYSHGDLDKTGTSLLKSWSALFARELESELRFNPKFGADLKVFFDSHHRPDQGLDPMVSLTDQLRDDISGSAPLAILMSEHYLKSRWCGDERDWWFDQQAENGLSHEERVAVVRISPTTTQWPKRLTDSNGVQLLGFQFYDSNIEAHEIRPFGWRENVTEDKQFRDALLKVTGALLRKLDSLKKRLDERKQVEQEVARLAGNTGQVVYLQGRMEQAKAWDKAYSVLADGGMTIMPSEPDRIETDPRKANEVRERRVEILSGCDALLLLGTENGRALDADMVVVGRQDRHSVRALVNRLLPCGLLDTVGASIATPQRQLAAKALQVDWIDATGGPWTDEVQRWLTLRSATAGQAL